MISRWVEAKKTGYCVFSIFCFKIHDTKNPKQTEKQNKIKQTKKPKPNQQQNPRIIQ